MTPAGPPKILGFTPESRDRIPLVEHPVFHASAVIVAPANAYRPVPYRPLRMPPPPVSVDREAKTNSTPRRSPAEDDLDKLMARLKAVAAEAQQLPPGRAGNKHLVLGAAIALSIISGAVTAQYLLPGHPRPGIVSPAGR